jgi:sugar phosphate isomerase/epimerase
VRFRHRDGTVVHLSYCSNVHPAEDVEGILAQLRLAREVRARLGVPLLGVGLWLPVHALDELDGDARSLDRLRTGLCAAGLEVVSLNGFPYGGFHDPVVKRAVYRPDWTEPERLDFTLRLAGVLSRLLPDDVAEGTLSTLPLAWREGWDGARARRSAEQLERLGEGLAALQDRTGRAIAVGLEPEPGCVAETTAQVLAALCGTDAARIGLCLDACHLAVQFEDPATSFARVRTSGRRVVKAQLSNALRAAAPSDPATRTRLGQFVEPRFLHQTRQRAAAGPPTGVDDLDEALSGGLDGGREWRVHFHVPVHLDDEQTTHDVLDAVVGELVDGPEPLTRHLEVETYTWSVLPTGSRPYDDESLVAGLATELSWARERLTRAGLEEIA